MLLFDWFNMELHYRDQHRHAHIHDAQLNVQYTENALHFPCYIKCPLMMARLFQSAYAITTHESANSAAKATNEMHRHAPKIKPHGQLFQ